MGLRKIRRLKKQLRAQETISSKLMLNSMYGTGSFFDYWKEELKTRKLRDDLEKAYDEYEERRYSHETY